MKKNSTMRIAAVLMVLTLMTSCFVGGTFAKYTTAGVSNDSARVAKFGVTVTGFTDMFAKDYKDEATDVVASMTVRSSTAEDVIAPGTQGTLTGFDVNGQPEVDVRVSYKVDVFTMENWEVDLNKDETMDGAYCPIVFTISKNGVTQKYVIGGGTATDVNSLITEIATAINTYTVDYQTNELLSGNVDDDLVISWRWYFDEKVVGNPLNTYQNDLGDTSLGDLAALDVSKAANINLQITCTVTQID